MRRGLCPWVARSELPWEFSRGGPLLLPGPLTPDRHLQTERAHNGPAFTQPCPEQGFWQTYPRAGTRSPQATVPTAISFGRSSNQTSRRHNWDRLGQGSMNSSGEQPDRKYPGLCGQKQLQMIRKCRGPAVLQRSVS